MENLCSELKIFVEKVVKHLDSYDAGDLLLSCVEVDERSCLLCQYKRNDFILELDAKYPGGFDCELKGECRITFKSIVEAFDFINLVETKRQKTSYPTIVLGKMPGTVL